MTVLSTFVRSFRSNDDGVTAVEYGLIASLVAVANITATALLGTNISSTFNTIAGRL